MRFNYSGREATGPEAQSTSLFRVRGPHAAFDPLPLFVSYADFHPHFSLPPRPLFHYIHVICYPVTARAPAVSAPDLRWL